MANFPGDFIWYELMARDVEAARRFYCAVVGWTAAPYPSTNLLGDAMAYTLWRSGAQDVGGMMKMPQDALASGAAPAWIGYLGVDDVDAMAQRIGKAGGAVHVPPSDIPGVGRMAMVADPQGAPFYVMRGASVGASHAFAAGRPGHCGWHELHTRDWEAALDFYGPLFGWRKGDAVDMGPMGTYQLFRPARAEGDAVGAMFDDPGSPAPHWLYYFQVDDIDAAAARIAAQGGKLLLGPHEVPGGSWILNAQDPQGALFALLGPRRT